MDPLDDPCDNSVTEMDERRYRLHAYQTVNEFKAYRLNRNEQCRLEVAMNTLNREMMLFDKDFKMRASRLKSRRLEMLQSRDVGTSGGEDDQKLSRSLSEPCPPATVRVRSGRKSAQLPSRDDCVLCEQISSLVLEYGAKGVKARAQSGHNARRLPDCQTKNFIDSIETTILPLRRGKTALGLENRGHLDVNDSLYVPHLTVDNSLTSHELNSYQRRLVKESTMMVPPDDKGHICSTLTSRVSRRTFPAKIDIQKRIGEFVKHQEEFNKENPMDEDIVAQCESSRHDCSNRAEKPAPKFISKREAMIQEVLQKLGLKDRDIKHEHYFGCN